MDTAQALSLAISILGAGAAVYAVAISRRALHWQQARDRQRQETRVRIEFEHGWQYLPTIQFLDGPPRPRLKQYVLTVSVVNDGETVEYLRSLELHPVGSDQEQRLVVSKEGGDRKLEPRERAGVEATVLKTDLVEAGFVAVAQLSTGREIVSAHEHVKRDMWDEIRKHNDGIRSREHW